MIRSRFLLFAAAFSLAACSSLHSSLPLTALPPPTVSSSTVFTGNAQAYRFADKDWIRFPGYDYEFMVLEKRFADHWEVIKDIHYRNPSYDGGAGPRDQTLYFVVRSSPANGGGLDLTVEGTLGIGTGHEAADGGLVLELAFIDRRWFVPFDSVRIRQKPWTGAGRLEETVELFSLRSGHEIPFMRMQEEGTVYKPLAESR